MFYQKRSTRRYFDEGNIILWLTKRYINTDGDQVEITENKTLDKPVEEQNKTEEINATVLSIGKSNHIVSNHHIKKKKQK